MNTGRRWFLSQLAGLSIVLLAGCNGGSDGPKEEMPKNGILTIGIEWPERSRMPYAAESALIQVSTSQGVPIAKGILDRNGTSGYVTYHFPSLTPGDIIIRITAHPEAGGIGSILADYSLPAVIKAGEETSYGINPISRIARIEVLPISSGPYIPGQHITFMGTAFDSDGLIVPILQSGMNWLVNDTTIGEISSAGILLCKKKGALDITGSYTDGYFVDSATISIEDPTDTVASLVVTSFPVRLSSGESISLTVVAKNAAGNPLSLPSDSFQWTTSTSDICSVTAEGRVSALKAGLGRITVREKKSQLTAEGQVFVAPSSNDKIPVRVLVLNFDPIVPSEGGKRMHEVIPEFIDPRQLAQDYAKDMLEISHGLIQFEIVEWRDINAIPAKTDGFVYNPDDYVRLRRAGGPWHEPNDADYPKFLSEQGVYPRVNSGEIDEVWYFCDHYFGVWESAMAGPGAFYINGPVFSDIPTSRPFVIMGFSYERRVAEMLHNTSHRTEATMERIYNGWNIGNPKTLWDKFTANKAQSPGPAGIGSCHFPANAERDYDYENTGSVLSTADDWLNFPRLTGATSSISRDSWGGPDYQRNYLKWFFSHLPHAPGWNEDGHLNHWWWYIYAYARYDSRGNPI